MPRLPQPGADDGSWGTILNEFLAVTHKSDGSLKTNSVDKQHLATNAVDARVLAASSGLDGQVLTRDTAVSSGLSWQAIQGGGATTSVVMAGDITGPSNNAQIASGVVGTTEIANASITGVKLSDGSVSLAKISAAPGASGDILTYNGSGLAWQAPTTSGILDDSITAPKLKIAGGSNGQSLVLDSTAVGGFKWETLSTGSTTPSGLAGGGLAGTYPNPSIASNAIGTAQISDGNVTTSKLADGSVTTAKLGDGSVTSDKIVDGSIVETDLASAVQTKLNSSGVVANGTLTPVKLSSDTPASGEILSYNGTSFEWIVAPSASVSSVNTRTGAVVISKSDVGLANADNTSDANKPISTATQTALALKATASSLAAVATSGSYADLTNRPAIPAQFSPVAGTNVVLSGTYPNITFSATPGAGVTNLSSSRTATNVTVVSSSGDDTILDSANATDAGVMPAADKVKLNGIATGSTANSTDAQLRDRTTHTGAQTISTITGLQAALDAAKTSVHDLGSITPGTLLVAPLDGSVNTSSSTARPSARTDIFFRWRSTVAPANMITGDEWYQAP